LEVFVEWNIFVKPLDPSMLKISSHLHFLKGSSQHHILIYSAQTFLWPQQACCFRLCKTIFCCIERCTLRVRGAVNFMSCFAWFVQERHEAELSALRCQLECKRERDDDIVEVCCQLECKRLLVTRVVVPVQRRYPIRHGGGIKWLSVYCRSNLVCLELH
jgi:hypothetical protein